MAARRISVLMGGFSAEREVSLVSGAAAVRALREAGRVVEAVDVGRDIASLIRHLETTRPDVVLNALHGRYGEDGCIQGVLNLMGIPYTHSGLLASALAMDKPQAKKLFASVGIPVAEDRLVRRDDFAAGDPLPRPYVVKPLNEGSSVGVLIVREGANDMPFADGHWPYGEVAMAERFIAGRELTVAVMGDRALAVTEITTSRGFYDYEAKYATGGSIHLLPAPIPDGATAQALDIAAKAHAVLGCRGVSRSDLRYDGETVYLLEVNTQPGMTPTSLVPEQAAHLGIGFTELVLWMVENAACDA